MLEDVKGEQLGGEGVGGVGGGDPSGGCAKACCPGVVGGWYGGGRPSSRIQQQLCSKGPDALGLGGGAHINSCCAAKQLMPEGRGVASSTTAMQQPDAFDARQKGRDQGREGTYPTAAAQQRT